MLNKLVSLFLSSIFIFTLLSSTVIAGSSSFFINEILAQNSQSSSQSLYTVRILPPSTVTIQDKDGADTQQGIKFTVQVARENKKGQFSAMLSTFSDTPALNVLRSFTPSYIINMEEGQSVKNATLTIAKARADSLTQGTYNFQVKAVNTRTNDIVEGIRSPPQALSNTGTIVVVAQQAEKSQSLSTNGPASGIDQQPSQNQDGTVSQQQQGQQTDQQRQPQQQHPNHPPIAKAGLNQQVNEGDNVILDAGTSTDPDTSTQAQAQALSYIWEQSGTNTKSLDIIQQSPNSPKARFTAPQVDEDTTFTFKLTVRDGKGGQASDSVNILVKNLVTQKQEQEQVKEQVGRQDVNSPQERVAKGGAGQETSNNAVSTNRAPAAQASIVSTEQNKQVSITLQGTDPDKEDKIIFELVAGPSHGTIAGFDKAAGTLTYIPSSGFTGPDSLKFKVVDSNGAESNEALVSISVMGERTGTQKGIAETVDQNGTTTKTDTRSMLSGNDSATTAATTIEEIKQQRIEERNAKIKETRGEKISNQYIVVLKDDTTAQEASGAVNDAKNRGVKLLGQYQKAIKGFTVNIPSALANREAALDAILNNSEVAYIEPDVKVKAFAVSPSTTTTAQTLPTGVNRVDGDLSTAISGDGKGDAINADIAILDTGIDLTHPDLNVYKHVTYIPGTTSGNDDSSNGHGTQVAGIAAAKDNDFGVVGIAPGARLWSIKVLDSNGIGSLSSVLQGLDYITQHANEIEVADMSFGCEDCNSPTLNTAITNAVAAGVTIITAAGNSAKDASTFAPANHADVIAVSAIADSDGKCGSQGQSTAAGADDSLAAFSNYGPAIDMAAPGVQIYSTSKNGGYSTSSGTSMAAPHVAGAAAIYMSEYPNASPSQVIKALQTIGSDASAICDGSGHGYFKGDKDTEDEKLLYLKGAQIEGHGSLPSANNSISPVNNNSSLPQGQPSANVTTPTGNATTIGNLTTPTGNATTIGNLTTPTGNATTIGNVTTPTGNATTIGNVTTPTGNATIIRNATTDEQGITFEAASGGQTSYTFARKWGSLGANAGQFSYPSGIALDSVNNVVYVVDRSNDRIQKFGITGNFILQWGTSGPNDGQFSTPRGIAVNPTTGEVYVADTGNHRIQKFGPTGNFLSKWGSSGAGDGQFLSADFVAIDASGDVYVTDGGTAARVQKFHLANPCPAVMTEIVAGVCFVTKWGTYGEGDGQFKGIAGIAVDSPNNAIYVADSECCPRIQKFTTDGAFVTSWTPSIGGVGPIGVAVDSFGYVYVSERFSAADRIAKYSGDGTPVATIGSFGSANGQLNAPEGVAVDPSGNSIYVSDISNNRVQVFTALSQCSPSSPASPAAFASARYDYFAQWGLFGNADGQFKGPVGIATDFSSNVYVGEGVFFPGNDRVQKFTSSGSFVTKWGSKGTGPYQFEQARHIAVDASCNVYVSDFNNARVKKFSGDGTFMTQWGSNGAGDGQFGTITGGVGVDLSTGEVYVADINNNRVQKFTKDGDFILKWGSSGSGDGQFNGPTDVAVDSTGKVYVTEVGSGNANPRVQKFDGTGNFISKWGSFGGANSQFRNPQGVATDAADNVYVADTENLRIQKFDNTGAFVTKMGTSGTGNAQFQFAGPYDISIDIASGKIYATDTANHRIQVFAPDITPPTVTNIYPANAQTEISVTPCICITFNEQMLSSSVNTNSIIVKDSSDNTVAGAVTYSTITRIASFNPTSPLDYSASYTATVMSGANGVKDVAGNPLSLESTWSFTTMVQPAPGGIHQFAGKWGSPGDGNGQFKEPFAIARDPNTGEIYVAEAGSSFGRIQKFSGTGTYLGTIAIGQVGNVVGIAVDPNNGDVYVAEASPNTIKKFSSTGTFITSWGSPGAGQGQFNGLYSTLGVDSSGNVFVADWGNHRIQKFSSTGAFITMWGSFGNGPNQFRNPTGIAFDSAGNVYVSDGVALSKYTNTGGFISKKARANPGAPWDIAVDNLGNIYETYPFDNKVRKYAADGSTVILTWGAPGTGNGQFGDAQTPGGLGPYGIDVDSSTGKIHVMDTANSRFQVFGPDSVSPTVVSNDPTSGQTETSVTPCVCVTFSEHMLNTTINTNTITIQEPDNGIVTAQVSYDSVNKLASVNPSTPLEYSTVYTATVKGGPSGVKDSGGNPIASDYTWTFTTIEQPPTTGSHAFAGKWGSDGLGNGQFKQPSGVDVDQNTADVYIADRTRNLIQKFKSDGTFVSKWGSSGSGDGQFSFNAPYDVAVDPNTGEVYTIDWTLNRVQKFSSSGVFLLKWGTTGSGNGQFTQPTSIAVDSAGNVYVGEDGVNDRVQKFSSTGGFITKWGGTGTGDGQFNTIGGAVGIDFDSSGNVYVVDHGNARIQKFSPTGAFLLKWNAAVGGVAPWDLSVDSQDNVYVSYLYSHHITKFTANGASVAATIGSGPGTANGQFGTGPSEGPLGIAVNPTTGLVYAADTSNKRIQFFGPDSAAPSIVSNDPPNGQSDVSVTPCACATFNEVMATSTINANTVTLKDSGNSPVAGLVSFDPVRKVASFTPSVPLQYSTSYTATIKGGASGVKDTAGNPLAADFSWSFATMVLPPATGSHAFAGKWGSDGFGSGQFRLPIGVDIDPNTGAVYVTDVAGQNRIQKFKSDGTFVTKWGSPGSGNGQFGTIYDVAIDPSTGDVYVADWDLNRIQKFSSSGVFLLKWGTTGSGNGQFTQPTSIAVDSAGNVYVGEDGTNDRVQKFDSDGNFITKWGGTGTGDGQFNTIGGAVGIDFDSSGNVYVVDHGNARIQKFSPTGAFLLKWNAAVGGVAPWDLSVDSQDNVYVSYLYSHHITKFTANGASVAATIGSGPGTANGQFGTGPSEGPRGIAVNPTTGLVYAADTSNKRIQFFNPGAPAVLSTSPSTGATAISITPCACVTFDQAMMASTVNTNTITLKEGSNPVTAQVSYDPGRKISSLNPSAPLAYSTTYTATVKGGPSGVKNSAGTSIPSDYTWSFTTMGAPPASSDPHPFAGRWGSQGAGNGQFESGSGQWPAGVDIDSAGNIYVVDAGSNARIQKFKSDGTFLTTWGTFGSGNGEFNSGLGIAIDSSDNVYVTDVNNARVQKFSSSGVFLAKWGSQGAADDQFEAPYGIAIDSANNVYVSDPPNHRVQKFDSSGNFVLKWGTLGSGNGQFGAIGPGGGQPSVGLTVDSADNIYVTDGGNRRIQKFDSTGNFLLKWGTQGSGDSQFLNPAGLEVDSLDNVYLADHGNKRIQKFTNTGAFITKWGTPGPGDGQFEAPMDIAINPLSGKIYVSDEVLYRIQVFGSPAAAGATIAITTVDKPSPLWGVDTIDVDGTTTGSVSGDVVKVTWGEEPNTLTDTVQIGTGGAWSATHNYGPTATGARNIVATVVGDNGVGAVKATSAPSVVTVQKHPTTLTISVPTPVVQDTTFTASGVIKDTAYSPAKGVDSQTISITGLTPNIASVVTGGIAITQPAAAPFQVFSCATCPSDANDGTKGNKLLRLNVGGEITIPENTFKLGLTFDESVASPQFELDVYFSDSPNPERFTNPRYIDKEFPNEVTKIKLATVAGSTTTGSIRIANLVTGDYHGYPYEQHILDFEDLTVGQSYPTPLVVNGGSYFANGRSPATASGSQSVDVQAQFAGSGAYLQSASGTASYELQEQTANLGTSGDTAATPTAYDATAYNQPTSYFGSGLTTNSAICANADPDGTGPLTIAADPDTTGPASAGDIDFDGICDIWESSTTPGNDATHRYITCPKTSSGAFIDVSGATPRALDCDNGTVRYDLCFTDAFSNVWSGQTAGKLVCPTVGHKDVFVELDYMTGHTPDAAAIKDVIMAFGNAPITKQYPTGAAQTADSFGRTLGITLHVVVDEAVTHVTQINVWTDGDTDLNNDLAHIKEGSGTSFIDGRFGKATERQAASGAKILNMKHYVYRWGLFAHTWGSTCGPSGMGETLGNDFLVSLGCGFGERNSGHAGTEGSRSEQAGTLMHELGHTLNLRHGGPAISAVGSPNYDMNCKVNYLSVMNYVRQFPGLLPTGTPTVAGGAGAYDAVGANPISKWEGVRLNTAGSAANGDPLPAGTGTSTWPGSSLDYSRAPMASLSETGLSEANGVRKADNTVITPAQKIVYGPTPNVIANTGANVNWNLDTDTVDTALARDINNVGIQACGATAGQIQTDNGKDDWSNLKFYMLHDTDTRDGAVSPVSQPARTPELTAAIVEDMKEEAPLQFTGVLPPPNQDGSTVAKLGTTIPIKMQLKDSSNKLITNAKLTFTAQKLPSGLPIIGNALFKYDTKNSQYVYNWKAPSASANQGTWAIRVYENYGTPDQRLVQGPQPPTATGETVRLSLKP